MPVRPSLSIIPVLVQWGNQEAEGASVQGTRGKDMEKGRGQGGGMTFPVSCLLSPVLLNPFRDIYSFKVFFLLVLNSVVSSYNKKGLSKLPL